MSDSLQDPPSSCRACASADVFGPLRLLPQTGMGEGNVLVSTMRSRPFGRPRTAPLAARVCRQCGHVVDLFATEPEVLFEHWSAENS